MNDQLIMESYLLILKSTVEVYVHGTIEASNNDIRTTLKDNLNDTLSCQARTFDKMAKNGWYPVNNVDTKTIKETFKQIKRHLKKFD